MKAVLDTKVNSAYDDDIADRYHFPTRYLDTLKRCVGDWVIFRQPRAAGGSKAYFATAVIKEIVPDPSASTHHYALIREFSPFDQPVPWRTPNGYAERALRELPNVSRLGLFLRGKSVRPLEEDDFSQIVEAGFAQIWLPLGSQIDDALGDQSLIDSARRLQERADGKGRAVLACLTNRVLRDRAFRRAVCRAYGHRCAVSGLSLTDACGHSEVQAAHILPVSDGGPDVVQNGIALSATVHWLFDRHMISIDESGGLLVAQSLHDSPLITFIGGRGTALSLPENSELNPAERYLSVHRRKFHSLHGP